jgi:acyl-CoA dehydrogenase
MIPGGVLDELVSRIETFVRKIILPYEKDARLTDHGPSAALVAELRGHARAAGLLTPHISADGKHMPLRQTAKLFAKAGLSPLGPVALNIAAPDEGNMFLLGRIATSGQRAQFLDPLIKGEVRSAFMMTEPSWEQGAGSDPSMMLTTAVRDGDHWIINGRKAFITGAQGAEVGIVMANTDRGAAMFLVRLPHPAVQIERVLDTLDSSMPGGHAIVKIDNLVVSEDQVLGEAGRGFEYAQVRLAPARLSHCMRWHGACVRIQEIACEYACRRKAFGRHLIDHEGVGFMLSDNLIELKQAELMIDWCAGVVDSGAPGTLESSMTKAAVSEGLYRIADRCVQIMGGLGVSRDTVVEQVFREMRAFRIYDGPTEVHKWSLAKSIKRAHNTRNQ